MKRTSVKLTKRVVDAAEYTGTETSPVCLLWDSEIRGLVLRVYPSGRKAYVCRYRNRSGAQRWQTLGSTSVLTLPQARDRARRLFAEVLSGKDPAEERKRAREAATFGELAEAYMAEVSSQKRSGHDDRQRMRDFLLPRWKGKSATDLRREDVAAMHRKLVKRGHAVLANRTLALVSAVYAWGEREALLPEGHPNPARRVSKAKERSRDRWLSKEEVRALLVHVESVSNPYIRGFFWLALLTGCRKSELLSARWEQVNLERRELVLPDTKQGRPHHVPLSPLAMQVLEGLEREEGNPFIFPGQRRGKHLVNVERNWRAIRKGAGVPDARIHDLRRTVGSWLAQQGVSLAIIGNVLGHSQPSTTAVYARFADDTRRQALEAQGQAVLQVVGGEHSLSVRQRA